MNRLFDPEQYPSPRDVVHYARPSKPKPVIDEPQPEPWVDPWVVISTRKGPIPYTHLPVDPLRMETLRRTGSLDRTSLMTMCGEVGWPISRQGAGIGMMLPCPACKANL